MSDFFGQLIYVFFVEEKALKNNFNNKINDSNNNRAPESELDQTTEQLEECTDRT